MKRIAGVLVIGVGAAAVLWGATSITTAGDIVVEGRVLRGTADPPCFDDTNRYVDCGNGTVTDTVTSLIWLANASCLTLPGLGGSATASYQTANEAAAQLRDGICGLSDGSRPGDWRLATKTEWEDTIDRAVALGCTSSASPPKGPPSLTDDPGTQCLIQGSTSFSGIQSGVADGYWSSSSSTTTPQAAFGVNLRIGSVGVSPKSTEVYVWPVRSGS